MIASAGKDRSVRIWKMDSGLLYRTFVGHSDEVKFIVIFNDNSKIISCGADKLIKIWDIESG